jgi:hypothetical protein
MQLQLNSAERKTINIENVETPVQSEDEEFINDQVAITDDKMRANHSLTFDERLLKDLTIVAYFDDPVLPYALKEVINDP